MPQKVFRMYLDYSVQYVPRPDRAFEPDIPESIVHLSSGQSTSRRT